MESGYPLQRLGRAILLTGAMVLAMSVALPAAPSDYRGHYELAQDDPGRVFSLDVTIKEARTSVSFSAGHPDGSGAAPDAEGEGKVDARGKLTFTFKDSFDNEGTGTLVAGKGGYLLTLTLTRVVDPSVLSLYDNAVLKKTAASP